MSQILVLLSVLCISFSSSKAFAEDDFFGLLGSALESVGLQINQFPQAKTVFLESPRISNVGLNDFIDFSFIDLNGQGTKVELILRLAPEKLINAEDPLGRLKQRAAIQEILLELEASFQDIPSISVANAKSLNEMGMLILTLQISKQNTVETVQGILTALLEGRQLVHAHALDASAKSESCAPTFKVKSTVH